MFRAVPVNPDSESDKLWQEYADAFRDYDDITLARWMAQTLGQFEGKAWRWSHPLMCAYRVAVLVVRERGINVSRLATIPAAYGSAECCGAPMLPMLTRDANESGLGCVHCGNTAMPLDELPAEISSLLKSWAETYAEVHAVAHWDDEKQKRVKNYEEKIEEAAQKAEDLLAQAGFDLAPKLLEQFAAVIWEDQDECLEVLPEDIPTE
jgi:hypothetical protein